MLLTSTLGLLKANFFFVSSTSESLEACEDDEEWRLDLFLDGESLLFEECLESPGFMKPFFLHDETRFGDLRL